LHHKEFRAHQLSIHLATPY
jgi:hypothetical protein